MVILNELCEGGTLLHLIEKYAHSLPEDKILQVFKEVIQGVKHMH